jgi:hypothetical protein
MSGFPAKPPSERFHGKYEVDRESGCWLWTAYISNRGYGTIGLTVGPNKSKSIYAHRLSYEMHHGPIPDGLVVDHICNVRRCVNPEHLQLLTPLANIERSDHPIYERRRQNVCVRGHDLTDPVNVYIRPSNGRRMCRACFRVRALERARKQGVPERSAPQGCGTYSGYAAHYRRGEKPCESCKEARNEYERRKASDKIA